jgi:hypothetical protein
MPERAAGHPDFSASSAAESPWEGQRGWTARLTVDDEVAVYCPECDEREFGDG